MDNGFLFHVFVFLLAACVVVPLVGRFKLGSVIGYLLAGVLIGPFGLGFFDDATDIMHFAEFGVIMMLFLIGLELDPASLWQLRKFIIGLGGLQVVVTSAVFTAAGMWLGFSFPISISCGMALSLSSTALVLQMLQEKGLMQTSAGESSFATLLFQDLAVIPILLLMPLLATSPASIADHGNILYELPAFLRMSIIAAVMVGITIGGRHLSRYLFRFVAKTNLREVFTATSLALVVGITLLMQAIGISPALGAFLAGIVLANSEYRHTLESDIQPFKGLLLGLFFISVGMGINFTLLQNEALLIAALVLALVVGKAAIMLALAHCFGLRDGQKMLYAIALAQGSEFAFVLFQYAGGLGILDTELSAILVLTVALSMALTPVLMVLAERFIIPRFMSILPTRPHDEINEANPVIIAGYGRFGQIIGRMLVARNINVTILESNPDQIEQIRKFGVQCYFGDASRLDLLHNAHADKAKILVVAVDNADKCLEIVRLAKDNFPNLKIFARARNRRHAYELHKAGVDYFRREMFEASLVMATEVLKALGTSQSEAERRAQQFKEHDEATLTHSFEFFEKEPELITFARQSRGELAQIMREDIRTTPDK